jgi:hypothetical protein
VARARNIKPGFFLNDDLAECSRDARLLFIGLWTIADREGRLADKPKRIKSEVFPYDNDLDCELLLGQLALGGFIVRYSVGTDRYIEIPKFKKHQTPHVKEKQSEIPAFSGGLVQAPDKHQTSTNLNCDMHPLNPESGYLNPECGMRKEENGSLVEACDKPDTSLRQQPDSRTLSLLPAAKLELGDAARSRFLASAEFVEVAKAFRNARTIKHGSPSEAVVEAWYYSLNHLSLEEAIACLRFSTACESKKPLVSSDEWRSGYKQSRGDPAPKQNKTTEAKAILEREFGKCRIEN